MPRAAGQVDERKSVAILDAAAELLAERGLSASMEEIARRAGVSKQTLYNRYGSRTALARALAARRSEALSAPLQSHETDPQAVLETFALSLLEEPERKCAVLRMLIQSVGDMPELAREVFAAGPRATIDRLARWLEEEDAAGRLSIPDARDAAEMFVGMVAGHWQLRELMAAAPPASPAERRRRAAAAAAAFVKAFAPTRRRSRPRVVAPIEPLVTAG